MKKSALVQAHSLLASGTQDPAARALAAQVIEEATPASLKIKRKHADLAVDYHVLRAFDHISPTQIDEELAQTYNMTPDSVRKTCKRYTDKHGAFIPAPRE